ncbi:hypothetical protein JD844_013529 [Phrynosoma platyrhinos]|uniref:Uncharacterized protein n=1 Tax=Phrynosoma platyrhinos TaxID=52577 RepID=A0ABQ7TL16_PHRPL|nr:hypothetical protein JD844_013529 [Phrynosoma platyrhinos]
MPTIFLILRQGLGVSVLGSLTKEGTDKSMEPKRVKLSLPGETERTGAANPIQALCDEAVCPICLGYFRDPVITECGHNFCLSCLAPWCNKPDKEVSCPQCREKIQETNIRPNRKLATVVEITKKLRLPGPKVEERKGRVCEKHQEPLKLFCENDEIPICVVCDRSKEHRDHEVIPQEEAYQKYKKQTTAEKKMMVAKFRQLHQFLEEQEDLLLAQIKEVEEEIARKKEEHLAKLSRELCSLESFIKKMKEKHQQPPSELLQVR